LEKGPTASMNFVSLCVYFWSISFTITCERHFAKFKTLGWQFLFQNFRDATPLSSDSLTYKKLAAILLFTSAKCPPVPQLPLRLFSVSLLLS
jgi:hypothetical protein